MDYYFLNNIFFFLTLLQKLYSKSQYKITIKAVDNFQIFLLIVHFIICFATDTVVALIDSVPETMGALIDSATNTAGALIDSAADIDGAVIDSVANTGGALINSATDTAGALIDSVADTAGARINSDLLQCKHFV